MAKIDTEGWAAAALVILAIVKNLPETDEKTKDMIDVVLNEAPASVKINGGLAGLMAVALHKA